MKNSLYINNGLSDDNLFDAKFKELYYTVRYVNPRPNKILFNWVVNCGYVCLEVPYLFWVERDRNKKI